MPGWGLLLGLGLPLLILFSWSRLGSETSRVQLERYADWSATHITPKLLHPLDQYFRKHKALPGPGDVELPAVPKSIGVKAGSIQPDKVLRVQLDAKDDGRPVVLNFVPVMKSAEGVFYDCVSSASPVVVGRFCRSEWLRSVDDIPGQVAANERFIAGLPAIVGAGGAELRASSIGSVVTVPADARELGNCGYPCVKQQSCVTPRPLACSLLVTEGNETRQEVIATRGDFRGSGFATSEDADRSCKEAQGEGSRVLRAGSMWGNFKLTGGNEYWVHDELRTENNCWTTAR